MIPLLCDQFALKLKYVNETCKFSSFYPVRMKLREWSSKTLFSFNPTGHRQTIGILRCDVLQEVLDFGRVIVPFSMMESPNQGGHRSRKIQKITIVINERKLRKSWIFIGKNWDKTLNVNAYESFFAF